MSIQSVKIRSPMINSDHSNKTSINVSGVNIKKGGTSSKLTAGQLKTVKIESSGISKETIIDGGTIECSDIVLTK